jgi:hypothetical protein
MADSAALLVDEILPHHAMRQWVLSVPFPLRFLLKSTGSDQRNVLNSLDKDGDLGRLASLK